MHNYSFFVIVHIYIVSPLLIYLIKICLGGQVQPSSTPGGPPTISSILKSDHHSINYNRDKGSRSHDVNRDSLATVSVVNTHHTHQPIQEMPKEGLVVVQVRLVFTFTVNLASSLRSIMSKYNSPFLGSASYEGST